MQYTDTKLGDVDIDSGRTSGLQTEPIKLVKRSLEERVENLEMELGVHKATGLDHAKLMAALERDVVVLRREMSDAMEGIQALEYRVKLQAELATDHENRLNHAASARAALEERVDAIADNFEEIDGDLQAFSAKPFLPQSVKRADVYLDRIRDLVGKQDYLNALSWVQELSQHLLRRVAARLESEGEL